MDIDIPRLRKVLRDTRHQVFDDDELRQYHKIAEKFVGFWNLEIDSEEFLFWQTVHGASWGRVLNHVSNDRDEIEYGSPYMWILRMAESEIHKLTGL